MTIQQLNYESACKILQAAGIDFVETVVEGYKVNFKLSKGDVTANIILDCESANIEQEAEFAVKSFERLVEWNRKENEKKEKRS